MVSDNQKAPAIPQGSWWFRWWPLVRLALPPRTSRLPAGAGNKGEEPKYEEVKLGEEAVLGLKADGHAATVGADRDGGVGAVGPGLGHGAWRSSDNARRTHGAFGSKAAEPSRTFGSVSTGPFGGP